MADIALINPPYRSEKAVIGPTYPLGLGYLQASCESEGISTDLFDFSCTRKDDAELISEYNLDSYKIIGITTFTPTFLDTMVFVNAIKLKNPKATIILGGHHANLLNEKVLTDYSDVDFVLSGFGEKSFPKLINEINGSMNFENISGLSYRESKIIKRNFVQDKCDYKLISTPNRKKIIYDFPRDVLEDTLATHLTISSSRGCPYSCNYCVLSNQNFWYERNAEDIIKEVLSCYESNKQYSIINFVDDNFFVKPKRAKQIIEGISRVIPNVMFSFQTRADQIVRNKALIKEISEKHQISIALGIESQSQDVLDRYNKRNTPVTNQRAVDILKELNVKITVFIIMFEAFESLSDIRKNFDFIKKNNFFELTQTTNIYTTLMPFYGTEYYRRFKDGYTKNPHGVPEPIFIDEKVQCLYNTISYFRNEFEDIIYEMNFKIQKQYSQKKVLTDGDWKILNYMSKVQYVIFESMLICCEKYGYCDQDLLNNSSLVTQLREVIKMIKDGEEIEDLFY